MLASSTRTVAARDLSRRDFLHRALLLGVSAPTAITLLAACEVDRTSDDDSTDATDDEPGDDPGSDVTDDADADDDDDDDEDSTDGDPEDAEDAVDADELGFDLSEFPDDEEVDLDELLAEVEQSFNVGPEHGWNVPELDPVNLDAGLPEGAEVRRYENPYVGELSEDLLIAISLSDAYGDAPRDAWVYLCDGQSISRWATGEVDPDGGSLVEGNLEVSFSIADGEITGEVALPNQDPQSFTALPAGDDAGLFQAEYTVDEVESTIRWIVHEDGRQRGQEYCCSVVCWGSGCAPICYPCRQRN